MSRRLASLLALALPMVGLAGLWASTDYWHRKGTDWLVPVEGYDPRDLLRGHYVEFRYAWPGAEAVNAWETGSTAEGAAPAGYPFGGCIDGEAPEIDRVVRLGSEAERAACPQVLAPDPATLNGYPDLPRNGRLYIPQTAGARLEAQLRNPDLQGMMRVRLRTDGTVTPLELTFGPRSTETGMGADAGDR